jgi:hypothetical protein
MNDLAVYGKKSGWTDTLVAPTAIILHHTACGATSNSDHPSLNYIMSPGPYAGKTRAANALLARDGTLHFTSPAYAVYHAGLGGPVTIGGPGKPGSNKIPKDEANRYTFGIEIEAHSSKKVVPYQFGKMDGITDKQLDTLTRFLAALSDMIGWSMDNRRIIFHRSWTDGAFDGNPPLPTHGRKIDLQLPLTLIREETAKHRTGNPNPPKPPTQPIPVPPIVKPPVIIKPPKPKPEPKKPTRITLSLKNLHRGANNKDVLHLQRILMLEDRTYTNATGPGIYGPQTQAAYTRYLIRARQKPSHLVTRTNLTTLSRKYGFNITD